jgi:hypothetical protein
MGIDHFRLKKRIHTKRQRDGKFSMLEDYVLTVCVEDKEKVQLAS